MQNKDIKRSPYRWNQRVIVELAGKHLYFPDEGAHDPALVVEAKQELGTLLSLAHEAATLSKNGCSGEVIKITASIGGSGTARYQKLAFFDWFYEQILSGNN